MHNSRRNVFHCPADTITVESIDHNTGKCLSDLNYPASSVPMGEDLD